MTVYKTYVYLSVIALFPSIVYLTDKKSAMINPAFSDVYLKYIDTIVSTSGSLMNCFAKCGEKSCLSFGYNRITDDCLIHIEELSGNSLSKTPSNGWNNYMLGSDLYKEEGCYEDPGYPRLFSLYIIETGMMTLQYCHAHCKSKHTVYFGLEYAIQCFCGNSLHGATKRPEGECKLDDLRCAGNLKQYCGGHWRLRVFKIK